MRRRAADAIIWIIDWFFLGKRPYPWTFQMLKARLINWYRDPFITHVDIYEHTKIEHRCFPYKLRLSKVESLQERIDKGGIVTLGKGNFRITEPIVMRPGSVLQGVSRRESILQWDGDED